MFTGLVQILGKVRSLQNSILSIIVDDEHFLEELKVGDSIAVNGICLSLTEKEDFAFSVFVSSESLKITNIASLKSQQFVNLEKPLKLNDFIHGHLVQGHIDGIGFVEDIYKISAGYTLKLRYPLELDRYIILKGSIAINGVSLTVAKKYAMMLDIAIIPETWQHTNFQFIRKGDKLNLETDMMGKYIEQFIGKK